MSKLSRRPWLVLSALLAVFIVPIVVAHYLYAHADRFNFQQTNHGILLNPAVDFSNLSVSNHPLFKNKQWVLAYYDDACCQSLECRHNVHMLHQLHIALNGDQHRVALALLTTQRCTLTSLNKQIPTDFSVIALTATANKQLQATAKQPRLFIVDPLANAMLLYTNDNYNPVAIYQDLKKLLKASQIG